MERKRNSSLAKIRTRARFRRHLVAAVLVAVSLAAPPSAHAATPVISRSIRNNFSTVQHFAGGPGCPATTEYATGNEHLVYVETSDGVHVSYGETFRILVVPDDPSLPSAQRQGTDALRFNLTPSGNEIFTESFHDFSPDLRISVYRTFVYANGEVKVDRTITRNPPSC